MLYSGKGLAALSNMKPNSEQQDHEKAQAVLRLISELAEGKKSGEKQGWLTLEDVKEHLDISHE